MSPTDTKQPRQTKSLHVPPGLHREIRILAGHRDEEIQVTATRVIEEGLKFLKTATSSIAS